MSEHPELRTTRLSFDYGGRPAIQDINMSVHGGEILGVLGPNGAEVNLDEVSFLVVSN